MANVEEEKIAMEEGKNDEEEKHPTIIDQEKNSESNSNINDPSSIPATAESTAAESAESAAAESAESAAAEPAAESAAASAAASAAGLWGQQDTPIIPPSKKTEFPAPFQKTARISSSGNTSGGFAGGSVMSGRRPSGMFRAEESISSYSDHQRTMPGGEGDTDDEVLSMASMESMDDKSALVLYKAIAKQRAMDEAAFRRRTTDAMYDHRKISKNEMMQQGDGLALESIPSSSDIHNMKLPPPATPSKVVVSSDDSSSVSTEKTTLSTNKNAMKKPQNFQSLGNFRNRLLLRRKNTSTTRGIENNHSSSRTRMGCYFFGCLLLMSVSLIAIAIFLEQLVQIDTINDYLVKNTASLRGKRTATTAAAANEDVVELSSIYNTITDDQLGVLGIDNATIIHEDLVLGIDNTTIIHEDALVVSIDNTTITDIVLSSIDNITIAEMVVVSIDNATTTDDPLLSNDIDDIIPSTITVTGV